MFIIEPIFLIFSATYLYTSQVYAASKLETLKYCCGLGTNYANSGLKCKSFQAPIAGIQKEDETFCLNSIDVCCKNQYRLNQCALGKEDAKSNKVCGISGDFSDFRKDCCEACQLGIDTGKTGQPCANGLGLGELYDNTFSSCCEDVLSSTSSTTTTTTTTTIKTTTVEEPKDVIPERKYRASPQPPLEDLCEIAEVCAQICIPTETSYRCECNKGYTLMADGVSCKPNKRLPGRPDRCETNNPCDHNCIDTGVAIRCSCRDGFELAKDKRTCKDIDECALGRHDCLENEVCVNEVGSYDCEDLEGSILGTDIDIDNKCPDGYKFDGENMVCNDINECDIGIICPPPKTCVNTLGSFTCEGEDQPQCPPGFYFKLSTQLCEDIDECVTGENDCNHESQVCLNTKGNFTCIDKASKKTCPAGFKKNPFTQNCEDINECEENDEICGEDICVNEPGSHTCIPNSSKKTPLPVPSPTKPSSNTVYISPSSTKSTRPVSITSISTTNAISNVNSISHSATVSQTSSSSTATKSQPTHPQPVPTNYSPQQETVTNPLKNVSTIVGKPYTYPSRPSYPNYYQSTKNNYPNYQTSNQPASCPSGYEFSQSLNRCMDINECDVDYQACDSNQNCYNTQGSYVCNCKVGFTKDYQTGACVDINECQVGSHNCIEGQRCDNTIGSYICSRTAGCGTGYTLNYASSLCEDDDECKLGTHNCNDLGPKFQCRNTLGSYRCERIRCIDCHITKTYTKTSTRTISTRPDLTQPTQNYPIISGQLKKCLPGYLMNAEGSCEDINECLSNPCGRGQKCLNLNGRYQCITGLQCKFGYELNEEGDNCVDINECLRGLHKCKSSQVCKNGPGYYTCQCPAGHQLNPVTEECEDIDECKRYRGRICSINSECINTVGSYKCRCKEGFRNNGDVCEDVDECAETARLCEQNCVNIWGSYRCSCRAGFTLNFDNRTCTDVDECEKFKDRRLCIGTCNNVPGSYTCSCPNGYRLGGDGRTCQDIDECSSNICPKSDDVCLNTRGGYKCHTIRCPPNYIRDPEHKSRCKRAPNACDSRGVQCQSMPEQYSFHFITFVSNLPVTDDQVTFFQMKGPNWKGADMDFTMKLVNVYCPYSVKKVNESYFRMNKYSNAITLSLLKPIEGPQEIEIRIEMKLFLQGFFSGIAVANIFIVVSAYPF